MDVSFGMKRNGPERGNMTENQKVTWDAKKLSRTWRIVIYWLIALPLVLVAQVILSLTGSPIKLPLEIIAGGTLTASGAYMGKRAVQAWKAKDE